MNDDSWREDLLQDANRYRDKWSIWKAAYYAGVLTVCGFFVATAPLVVKAHPLMPILTKFVSACALMACACVIWNMLIFIRLYDLLGFAEIPKKEDQVEAYYDKQVGILSAFAKKAPERKARDWLTLGLLIGAAGALGVALCL